MEPMLVGAVHPALWGSPASTMEAANRPSSHGRRPTPLLGPFRGCRAPQGFLEGILPFHEVGSVFFSEGPLPPPAILPTIAWPPSLTVTCPTRIVWSPTPRYRLSAST